MFFATKSAIILHSIRWIVWTLYLPNSAVELGLGFIGIDRIEKTPLELGRLAQFQFRFSGDMWSTGSSKG
ncbi:MAG: hypothetical protein VW893_01325, partial [Alphaproteobacteria bacterium]